MKTFIRVAEVWVPSAEGGLLELGGGLFDAAPAFGAISRTMCFGRGEGLPGRAWEEGRPLLLHRLEGSYFRRVTAARAAGLSCAVALPIFIGERLTSVVVLLCGDSDTHVGAIELWRNDPRIESDLRLADGYFGSTDPSLEDLTRDGSLSRGTGLPGLAWQREASVFIDNIGASRHFLRAQTAARAGIVRGLAIPCSTRMHQTWVLSLLSSQRTPIARRIESWLPDDSGRRLQRAFAFCESAGSLPACAASSTPVEASIAINRAWTTSVAQVAHGSTSSATEPPDAGSRPLLALPVIGDDVVSEVIALYF